MRYLTSWVKKFSTELQCTIRSKLNQILRFNCSPLTISLVKHNHSINDNHEQARPSSCFHSGVKQNQTKFLKFGVIYQRNTKPFKVKMGPVLFDRIQFFNSTSVDIKGPLILKGNKAVYILVMLCLKPCTRSWSCSTQEVQVHFSMQWTLYFWCMAHHLYYYQIKKRQW